MLMCENCDREFAASEAEQADGLYDCEDNKRRAYCCDACYSDDEDERRVGRREAAREFEIWGTDFDSWYR